MEIIYRTDSVFHSLSHFTDISLNVRNSLLNEYGHNEIQNQLNMPGSKFYSSFVKSPQELIEILQSRFPIEFQSIKPESDGKVRLSFKLGYPIGTTSIVSYEELTEEEKKTIMWELRNGCRIRTVDVNRRVPTEECQLILISEGEQYYFCTAFPGELAPPLPHAGETGDPYWDTHLFIR